MYIHTLFLYYADIVNKVLTIFYFCFVYSVNNHINQFNYPQYS